jgi:glycosyltransferase involved in cell wall biosynthesis
MRVVVVLEHRFRSTPDGRVWTDGPFASSFFARYLDQFEHVEVVARVQPISEPSPAWLRADCDRVTFAPVPYYVGPREYLTHRQAVTAAIKLALQGDNAVVLRAPGQLANVAAQSLIRGRHPYGAEIVGDPYDAFVPGVGQSSLRPLFRWQQTRALKRLCRNAASIAYVTASALQRRYPPAVEAFSTHYSSVELPDEAFVSEPPEPGASGPVRLITVGFMEHLYKGQDVLLRALAICRRAGLDFTLTLVGDGSKRTCLEDLADSLRLGEAVRFAGQLPSGAAVRQQLDQADIFVLPSRQEGVPRAMIEAMARGLPCLGSSVGGIPELLPESAMAAPDDATALTALIRKSVSPKVRRLYAAQNLVAARAYGDRELQGSRRAFYKQITRQTALQ